MKKNLLLTAVLLIIAAYFVTLRSAFDNVNSIKKDATKISLIINNDIEAETSMGSIENFIILVDKISNVVTNLTK